MLGGEKFVYMRLDAENVGQNKTPMHTNWLSMRKYTPPRHLTHTHARARANDTIVCTLHDLPVPYNIHGAS